MTCIAPDCLWCKWFNRKETGLKCAAFPNGIPENIIEGEPHNKVLPGQTGDKVFEKARGRK